MNTPITFTPTQLIGAILAICAAVVTIAKAIDWIAKGVRKAKKPNDDQNSRLDAIEKRLSEFEQFFSTDKERLDAFERSNRITQRALLALLSHGIDGNDIDGLRKAQQELTDHLIEQ